MIVISTIINYIMVEILTRLFEKLRYMFLKFITKYISPLQGKKCKKGCPKINVMHNQEPTPKKPEEEMLLLRTTRQITLTDDMKHSLEVEFKSPRNYIPLPEPGPTPSIIIPKEPVILKKLEDKEKKKEVKQ